LIQANFPGNAWIVVAGDLNTDTRTESAMLTLRQFSERQSVPADAEIGGNSFTSINRNHPQRLCTSEFFADEFDDCVSISVAFIFERAGFLIRAFMRR